MGMCVPAHMYLSNAIYQFSIRMKLFFFTNSGQRDQMKSWYIALLRVSIYKLTDICDILKKQIKRNSESITKCFTKQISPDHFEDDHRGENEKKKKNPEVATH